MKQRALDIEERFQKAQPPPQQGAFFTLGLGGGKVYRSAILSLKAKLRKHRNDEIGVKKVSLTIFLTSKWACWCILYLKMKIGRVSMQKEYSCFPAVEDLLDSRLMSDLGKSLLPQASLSSYT